MILLNIPSTYILGKIIDRWILSKLIVFNTFMYNFMNSYIISILKSLTSINWWQSTHLGLDRQAFSEGAK